MVLFPNRLAKERSILKQTKTLTRPQLFYLLLALLAVCAIALRSVALTHSFNAKIGYFEKGVLPILFYVVEGVAVALCIVFPFLIKKEDAQEAVAPASLSDLITAGLCGLLMIAMAIVLFINRPASETGATVLSLLYFLDALFLLAGSAFFLCKFREKQALSTSLVLGFTTVPAFALMLGILYFDLYTPMNAPHKVSLQIALLAIMIALLYELRVTLDVPRPRAAAAVYGFSAFFCATVGFSNTIAFLTGAYQSILYLIADLVCVAFAFYFANKCLVIALPKENKA